MLDYEIGSDYIKIRDTSSFNPQHILECGQVFSYAKNEEGYICFPEDKFARILKRDYGYLIQTSTPQYFVKYFDLDKDYDLIKRGLGRFEIMKKPLEFGSGIRILNQNLFETLISFIISANNNIPRIKKILLALRETLGEKTQYGHAFPSRERILEVDEEFFKSIGAGYRAKYLVKVIRQVDEQTLESWRELDSPSLSKNLLALAGVGEKVRDCVMLFGYHRGDVFPVDTWIEKMYNSSFSPLQNRIKMGENLVAMFGDLSGYAQQYLFFYERENEK